MGGNGKTKTIFFSQKKSPPRLNISYGNNSLRRSLISKATFSNALLQDCPVILVYNNTLIMDKQGGTLSWVRPWKFNQKLLQKVHIHFLEAPSSFQENKLTSGWTQSTNKFFFSVFKYWKGIASSYLNGMFMPSLNNYNNRSQIVLDTPHYRSNKGQNRMPCLTTKVWNKLSSNKNTV